VAGCRLHATTSTIAKKEEHHEDHDKGIESKGWKTSDDPASAQHAGHGFSMAQKRTLRFDIEKEVAGLRNSSVE
jgi:hypothetical protein